MALVLITVPHTDQRGNLWSKDKEYEVSEETADQMIRKGKAKNYFYVLIERLESLGAGLLVGKSTNKDLKRAAKEYGITMKRMKVKDLDPNDEDKDIDEVNGGENPEKE